MARGRMAPMGVRREVLAVGALCGAWYALSSASNVVGKLALTEFPFPMTVAMVQLLSTAALSAPALAACGVRAPSPSLRETRALLPLAFAKFLTTLCSQVSIWKVPVSYAHTGECQLFIYIFHFSITPCESCVRIE